MSTSKEIKASSSPSTSQKSRSIPEELRPVFNFEDSKVDPAQISSAEMNRRHQQKVKEEARELKQNKMDELGEIKGKLNLWQLRNSPELKLYHPYHVNQRNNIIVDALQEDYKTNMNYYDKQNIIFGSTPKKPRTSSSFYYNHDNPNSFSHYYEDSVSTPIRVGGRKKRTQKRKLRKTKRKKQNKRKSRKSRK
jgi:hypothetical protein